MIFNNNSNFFKQFLLLGKNHIAKLTEPLDSIKRSKSIKITTWLLRFLKTVSQQIAQKQFSEVHQRTCVSHERVSLYISLVDDTLSKDLNMGDCFDISVQCGPPHKVSFSRHSGRLAVNVSWQKEDIKAIQTFTVRYKTLGSLLWNRVSIKHLITKNTCASNFQPAIFHFNL